MPTKWTGHLTHAQLRVLEACDGRGVLGIHISEGILPVWRDTHKTVLALVKRGLIRQCSVPKDKRNGITLTKLGAETLDPPAKFRNEH